MSAVCNMKTNQGYFFYVLLTVDKQKNNPDNDSIDTTQLKNKTNTSQIVRYICKVQ